jgi:hypothetical protein
MMSTRCSKHVEAWNKYIKKEWVKLVINQNYVKLHGQQNIKLRNERCPWQRGKCPSSIDCLCRRNLKSLPNYRTLPQHLSLCTGCHSLDIHHIHHRLKAMFFLDKSKEIQHSKSDSINSQAHDKTALPHAVFVTIIHRFLVIKASYLRYFTPTLPKPVCSWADKITLRQLQILILQLTQPNLVCSNKTYFMTSLLILFILTWLTRQHIKLHDSVHCFWILTCVSTFLPSHSLKMEAVYSS